MSDRKPTLGRDMDQSGGSYEMVLSAVVFTFAGLWLDGQLGWTPVFTIALSIVGFTGGVLAVYYRYKRDIAAIEGETASLRERAASS